MNKLLSLVAGMLVAATMMAQDPVITFEKETHDFGKINEADGKVSTVFNFKNEGPSPLVLSNVRASCGCTTPQWPREPIEPGAIGAITVTYNASGRPGKFSKTITITSNATEPTKRIYIKGEVIPKPVQPVITYPVKIGELSLMTKQINFGDIYKGQAQSSKVEYANQSEGTLQIEASQLAFLNTQVSLAEAPVKTTGQLNVEFDTKICPEYGPFKAMIFLTVNGKTYNDVNDAIVVTANIKEDFSQMTVNDKLLAPIADIPTEINLGVLPAGKKVTKSFPLTNAGSSPLYIRRIVASDDMQFPVVKNGLKPGKKEIRFVVNTNNMEPSNYQRTITVITNDPVHPIQNIRLVWNVQ